MKYPSKLAFCLIRSEETQLAINQIKLPFPNVLLNKDLISFLGITRRDINKCIKEASIALAQYKKEFEGYIGVPDLSGKTAVVVDDGIASGFTVLGALNLIRQRNPKHIIIATPVCSSIAIEILKSCDVELIHLVSSDSLSFLVDDFYIEFDEVSFGQAHLFLASLVDVK